MLDALDRFGNAGWMGFFSQKTRCRTGPAFLKKRAFAGTEKTAFLPSANSDPLLSRLTVCANCYSSGFDILRDPANRFIKTHFPSVAYLVQGGLYDRRGALVRNSIRPGGIDGDLVISLAPEFLPPPQRMKKRFKGRSVFLGPFMDHYGHFITESLSRFWLLDHAGFDHVVFSPFVFGDRQREYHRELFKRFGLSSFRVIHEPCSFDELYIPDQLWKINSPPDAGIDRVYRHIKKDDEADPRYRKKYFLSRREKACSRITNLKGVEAVFERLGFVVVFPEDRSMRDQLKVYRNAKILAAGSGSAMHNTLFAGARTILLEVGDKRSKDDFHSMQKHAASVSGRRHLRVNYVGGNDGAISLQFLEREVARLIEALRKEE